MCLRLMNGTELWNERKFLFLIRMHIGRLLLMHLYIIIG